MVRDDFVNEADGRSEIPALKQIFDQVAEETISEEQVQRVLAPVLARIHAGEFGRPRRFAWLWQPVAAVAAVALLALTVAVSQGGLKPGRYVTLPDIRIPLAAPAQENRLDGRVMLADEGVGGVELELVDAESMERCAAAVTAEDGSYSFRNIADGSYRLRILPPAGMTVSPADATADDAGVWVTVNGERELIFGEDGERSCAGVDIPIWTLE